MGVHSANWKIFQYLSHVDQILILPPCSVRRPSAGHLSGGPSFFRYLGSQIRIHNLGRRRSLYRMNCDLPLLIHFQSDNLASCCIKSLPSVLIPSRRSWGRRDLWRNSRRPLGTISAAWEHGSWGPASARPTGGWKSALQVKKPC